MPNDALAKEFSNLVVNIGKDVSREYLLPYVKSEFSELREGTDSVLRRIEARAAALSDILRSVSDDVHLFKNYVDKTVEKFEVLNDEFINKSRQYLENTDMVKRAEMLEEKTTILESTAKELWDKAAQLTMDLINRTYAVDVN